eukprot:749821-Hanusia_phi.AAC.16
MTLSEVGCLTSSTPTLFPPTSPPILAPSTYQGCKLIVQLHFMSKCGIVLILQTFLRTKQNYSDYSQDFYVQGDIRCHQPEH